MTEWLKEACWPRVQRRRRTLGQGHIPPLITELLVSLSQGP